MVAIKENTAAKLHIISRNKTFFGQWKICWNKFVEYQRDYLKPAQLTQLVSCWQTKIKQVVTQCSLFPKLKNDSFKQF